MKDLKTQKQSTLQYRDFTKLTKASELEEYFCNRNFKHKKFCHYTSLQAINSILGGNTLYISTVTRFNDKIDTEQFSIYNPKTCFSLCFTTGINENLPLWYLYAGKDGKGGRIEFSDAAIKNLLLNSEYILYEYDYNHKSLGREICQLKANENMALEFRDILYSNFQGKTNRGLKYNNLTNYLISDGEIDAYQNKHIGFNKNLIWYYEKETRLFIRLINSAATTVTSTKNQGQDYIIAMRFGNVKKLSFKICLAPEITDIEQALKENNLTNLKNFLFKTSNIHLSEHSGEIKMNIK